jgi:uncharacterized protein
MNILIKIFLIALAVIVLPVAAFAYANPGAPKGFVNDYVGVMSVEQRTALENKLTDFEKKTGHEISIVVIKTLNGDTIENFATELFKDWGIGKKGKDNGVLILIAIDDRRMRIEVGYGLEGSLTDAQSSWIINDVMKPAFRNNEYYGGVDKSVDKIIAATAGEAIPSLANTQTEKKASGFPFEAIFYLGIFLVQFLAAILGKSKSWWAGGVIGGVVGVFVLAFKGVSWGVVGSIALLIPLGLYFDYVVSNAYQKGTANGHVPWWIGGGRGGSSGGGFGGFGGGMSGGGGSSGRW